MAPKNLAGSSHFKAFRHRLLCFASRNRLWHKEPGKYALDLTWQEEIWVMRTIAAKEPNNSHKDRKEGREKYSFLDSRQLEAHHVLQNLKFVATKVHQ
jgi:hypothetical protein